MPKEMEDTLFIGMVLLSPRRLLSPLLVSEASNRDIASQSIKHLEDTFSVLACKCQPFQYQLVALYTQHTHGMMHCYKRMPSSCLLRPVQHDEPAGAGCGAGPFPGHRTGCQLC